MLTIYIGPHIVVRGGQKNYSQFLNYNFDYKPDNLWFEDAVSKAILFMSAERIYGVKPNAIGDLRYITVPYSIAWLALKLNYKLDLYKIWKSQSISDVLKDVLYKIMQKVETFIKSKAPGSLYGEWAKKEECWVALKNENFDIDLQLLSSEIIGKDTPKRKVLSDDDTLKSESEAIVKRLSSIHTKTWKKIEDWGRETQHLSQYQYDMASTLRNKFKNGSLLSDLEKKHGEIILDKVAELNPSLFYDMDDFFNDERLGNENETEIDLELIARIVQWDKKYKKLDDYKYLFMVELLEGKKALNDRNKYLARMNLKFVEKLGFK